MSGRTFLPSSKLFGITQLMTQVYKLKSLILAQIERWRHA